MSLCHCNYSGWTHRTIAVAAAPDSLTLSLPLLSLLITGSDAGADTTFAAAVADDMDMILKLMLVLIAALSCCFSAGYSFHCKDEQTSLYSAESISYTGIQ